MHRRSGQLVGSVLLALVAVTAGTGLAVARDLRVRYLSADFIYLDGGISDSLAVGDTLRLSRGPEEVGKAIVEHSAQHSAACRLLDRFQPPQIGDTARIVPSAAAPRTTPLFASPAGPESPETGAGSAPEPAPMTAASGTSRLHGGVSGYAALQWYRFADRSGYRVDYDQPTLRLQMKVRRLFDRSLTFEMRGRARRDQRQRRLNGSVPVREWSNRVYALSLSYDERNAAWNWRIGRIVSNALAAAGPVDGALVELRVSPIARCGVFGGVLPDQSSTAPRGSFRKYGLFLRGEQGEFGSRRWSAAVAGTAEYHGSSISRQYAYVQADFQSGRRWSLHESHELDLNTGWRRSRGAAALSVTSAYASVGYRPTSRSSLGLSYDNRRNYWTWDNRSLPDSLFDAALRTGLRLNANVQVIRGWSAHGSVGRQHEQGHGEDTWSWSSGLTGNRILSDRVSLTMQATGFTGRLARGFSPLAQLRKTFRSGNWLGMAGGAYIYRPRSPGGRRTNKWARVEGTGQLPRRIYLSGQYERDWGTDVKGDRMIVEMGIHL